jgi:MFS transporter, PPP family, 3-phenylpropionic acid transporter
MALAPLPQRALFAFAAVSFAYFAHAGLFGTYAPLWFQSLGYSTLAIGALASLQSATRVVSPYAWGWLADHTGKRTQLLRVAVALALCCAVGFVLLPPSYVFMAGITTALFICTAGVVPMTEAALAHRVTQGGHLNARQYGRVRMWGSIGFMCAVVASGLLLERLGVAGFPWLVIALLVVLLMAVLRLPVVTELSHSQQPVAGVFSVLRQPLVAWFFAGIFFAVLAHTSLYAFFSLYLVSLGYSKSAVGLIWAVGVSAEVLWFWFQGRWMGYFSLYRWLLIAAVISVLRFAGIAAWGSHPWVLVLLQLTHAFTFAAQHSACIGLVNAHFPGRLRSRGQALYTVLGYGVSGVVGGLGGGALSQALGFKAVFWAASVAAAMAVFCCWRAQKSELKTSVKEA